MRRILAFLFGCLAAMAAQSVTARDAPLAPAALQAAAPPIVSRQMWGAKPAISAMEPQDITGIILHHTGVAMNPAISLEAKMRGLQEFSQHSGKVSDTYSKPAWPDVPYHFYIDVTGRIAQGRDVRFAGDTNTKYDTRGYIQIAVEGDFEKEMPDRLQLVALRDLLAWLRLTWNLADSAISVHRDHAQTDCPGRNFMAALPALRVAVAQRRREIAEAICRRHGAAHGWPQCLN